MWCAVGIDEDGIGDALDDECLPGDQFGGPAGDAVRISAEGM